VLRLVHEPARGCGWCVRAMPQVRRLAERFANVPVVVLGMNTDDDAADAQLVIDALQLNYPTLKADGLPEKYEVRGFPTLLVLDQSGRVQDIRVGYSPTLFEDVAASIESLLANPPQ
jgi:thiol-disulfide isomerase/thioredoxin